ncbi:MAG: discoidin domain-containing protein [Candidatus Margulisiibacteriota bacterium]
MKKIAYRLRLTAYGFLAVSCLLLAVGQAAEIYNYALNSPPVGTFTNAPAAADNSLATAAVSGNIAESPQYMTFDLGSSIYVGSVNIYWDAGALSRNYSVRVSNDRKNWITEFSGLDASTAIADPATGAAAQNISTRRYTVPSRFVQIYIPVGGDATASEVKIHEVQILPAQNLRFQLLSVAPYAVTNHSALIVYRTTIGAVNGQVLYGTNPSRLDQVAANLESGVINSVTLTNLSPDQAYYYRVKAWDAFGNQVESGLSFLRPPRVNLAISKKVAGTFTSFPPNDPLVDKSSAALPRAVDGLTGYFKGMATSTSVRGSDQSLIIDLGGSFQVSSVVSYWRALAYPESFSIGVSLDGNAWTELSNQINAGAGGFARSDAGDPMRVVSTDLNGAVCRYVRIFIPKDSPYFVKHADWDFVQLMEVEVYPK